MAYRLWLGGAGATSGMAAALASGLVGLGCAALKRRYGFALRSARLLFALGVDLRVLVGAVAFALLHPAGSAQNSIVAVTVPLLLVTPLGTLLLGTALQWSEDERRLLQEKLGEQAMLLEATFRSIGNGIIVADDKGNIVMTNPTARALSATATGAQNHLANIQQTKALHIDGVTPMKRRRICRWPGHCAATGQRRCRNESSPAPTASISPVNVAGRPLIDAAGNRRGGVIAFRDISREQALRESVRRSERRLRDAIDAMDNGFALFERRRSPDRLQVPASSTRVRGRPSATPSGGASRRSSGAFAFG